MESALLVYFSLYVLPYVCKLVIRKSMYDVHAPYTTQALVPMTFPAGASEILGLEVAGVISAVANGVSKFKKGDRVMALLDGGGYAEYAAAPQGFVMPLPDNLSFTKGAGIPEVNILLVPNL